MPTEKRFLTAARAGLNVRADGDNPPRIEGYGAVFYDPEDPGTEYKLWSNVYERIAPGAFERAIREDDVRSLFNHDANIVLGRNRSDPATLTLKEDDVGLFYSALPPDTQLARDQVIAPIERGDVDGSSFMFVAQRVVWIEEKDGDREVDIRQIEEVELWETGPVVFPAYESTTTGVRSARAAVRANESDLAEIRREHARWRGSGLDGRDFADVEARLIAARMAEVRRDVLSS